MVTIKAGTYRFNDVLSVPNVPNEELGQSINFIVTLNTNIGVIDFDCSNIYIVNQEVSIDDKGDPYYKLYLGYYAKSASVDVSALGITLPSMIGVYEDVWFTEAYTDDVKTITIPNDTEVSAEFYEWFSANANANPVVSIHYNGSTIANLFGGQTATLKCAGMIMADDVVVEVAENCGVSGTVVITENGTYDVTYTAGVKVNCPSEAVCGVWNFLLDFSSFPGKGEQKINFATVLNGETVECIGIITEESNGSNEMYYRLNDGTKVMVYAYGMGEWEDEGAKIVDFGEPQVVFAWFKEYMTTYATRIEVEAENDEILEDCNEALASKGAEAAETLEQVPQRIVEIQSYSDGYDDGLEDGKRAGKEEAEAETFFTDYGMMYKRNMVITSNGGNIVQGGYQYANELETVDIPYVDVGNGLSGSVFRNCEKLKRASLPRIRRIGNTFFGGCLALEEVTLGCAEVPIVQINPSSFQSCPSLVRMNLVGAIATSFKLDYSPLLDDVSRQNIVDALADLTGTTAQTLSLHAEVGAKLTETQKATITAKNWTLVY